MCQANTADRDHRAIHGSKETRAVVCGRGSVGRVVLGALILLTIHWAASRPAYSQDFIVNSTGDEADATPRGGICETAPRNGTCTLRAAIEQVNAVGSRFPSTIKFNIPTGDPGCNATTGVCTITPGRELPLINFPVIIDGYTQPEATPNTNGPEAGSNAELKIELNGANAGAGAAGVWIRAEGDGIPGKVRGLVINRFAGEGILLDGGSNAQPHIIEGNFIGTDVTGTIGLSNGLGIFIRSPRNAIGGITPAARNLISGHTFPCEFLGCGHGIFFNVSVSENNMVEGNLIGTDVTGMTRLGNRVGVGFRLGATSNTIGGTTPTARNIISGNLVSGIFFDGRGAERPSFNTVWGNYIGTDVTGQAALGNQRGVIIESACCNTVGVSVMGMDLAGAGNVISGNTADGIRIIGLDARSNAVRGNLIGTDATGRIGLGNSDEGIEITDAPENIIGGEIPGAGNVISDNVTDGIRIQGSMAMGNRVRGNLIGTDVTGTVALPNDSDGVEIRNASHNRIGGLLGARNIIVFTGRGVNVRAFEGGTATGNAILSNLITSNVPAVERGLAIDLGGDGFTPNDQRDLDTGANNRQNFPTVTAARSTSGGTSIQGMLRSTPNRTFEIQFFSSRMCNPSNRGLAERFIGSMTVRTDSAGNAPINAVTERVPADQFIIATATNGQTADTSEFSLCVRVTE